MGLLMMFMAYMPIYISKPVFWHRQANGSTRGSIEGPRRPKKKNPCIIKNTIRDPFIVSIFWQLAPILLTIRDHSIKIKITTQ